MATRGSSASVMGMMRGTTVPKAHDRGCTCPVCAGLQTFVRPRFFAGQLLTDTELTTLTTYVVDKQRLHNIHLHGWGVGCGLQVECDGCGPGVVVRPGYAIDPCGYDIVVPSAVSVDVLGLINACTAVERAPDCDPPRLPKATGCDQEETWCLTVRYREQDARPVTPLGATAMPTCSCNYNGNASGNGCGCGGSSGRGGCGCGGSTRPGWDCGCANGTSRSTTTCACTAAPRSATRPADCEPSRTYEGYEFGVCRSDGSCHDLGARLDGTFPAKLVECIKQVQPVVSKRMTPAMQRSAGALLLGGAVQRNEDARQAVCTIYDNVLDLYRKDPLRAQCVLPAELNQIDCSPQQENETDSHYLNRLTEALQALVILVLLYLRDCVCYHLMPPCPDAPCDDRVVLACVTVKNGRVESICNHDCRRYAGSFVSRDYWLPVGPVLSWLAGLICCFPLLDLRPRLRGLSRYEGIRAAIRRDDFAALSMWRSRAGQLLQRLRPSVLFQRADSTLAGQQDNISLARFQDGPIKDAVAQLQEQGVTVEQVQVAEAWEAPIKGILPSVPPGGAVRLYVHAGQVVGFDTDLPQPTAQQTARATKKTAAPRGGDGQ